MAGGVFLLLRFGILAAVACGFAGFLLQSAPLSLDTSAWYFGASLTYLAVVVGLAGYAAWISLGNRWPANAGLPGEE